MVQIINKILIVVYILCLIAWFIHIPFALDDNVLKYFELNDSIASLLKQDSVILFLNILCGVIAVIKKKLDCKYKHINWLKDCTIAILNIAFIIAWFSNLIYSVGFHCHYYWAIDCKNNIESHLCGEFPIEVDIAYLFITLSLFVALVVVWIFIINNRILKLSNNILFFIFLIINVFVIYANFGRNGAGCYD